MMKKERKMKKIGFTRKILDDFQGLPLLLLLFSSKSSTVSMILFRNVSLSRGTSTTRFGWSPFFVRRVTIFIGHETKTHIFLTKIDKISQRSAHLTKIILDNNNTPFLMDLSEQPRTGVAQRRKQRRLRSWWRHEQQSIAAALATVMHHSSRGQRKARAGEEESELHYTDKDRKTPPPQPVLFSLYEEEPGGRRPASLAEPPGPQERVQRHAMEQLADVTPMVHNSNKEGKTAEAGQMNVEEKSGECN